MQGTEIWSKIHNFNKIITFFIYIYILVLNVLKYTLAFKM